MHPEPKKLIIYANGKHSNLYNFRNDLDILDWINANENGWLTLDEESLD